MTLKRLSISIVVITHNEEKNIADCLDSLMNLDYPEALFEIIVVDSSNDRTPEIASSYSGVRLVTSKEKGFSLQRNLGIKEAKNEVIAFTDADCIVPKEWLDKINLSFKKDIDAVSGNAYPPKDALYIGRCIAALGFPGGGSIGLDANFSGKNSLSAISTCNTAIRRAVLKKIKGFNTTLKYGGEDTELSKRLKMFGYKITYNPELYVYHKTRNSLKEFVLWTVRRGKADFKLKKPSLVKLLISPFNPIFGLLWFLVVICSAFLDLWIAILFLFGSIALLPLLLYITARKYRLLISRLKRIELDDFSAVTVVPFLYYLRRLLFNVSQIGQHIMKG